MGNFSNVFIGSTSEEVTELAGKPYNIHKKKDGTTEYEYIERLNSGLRTVEERHYYIVLKEGVVIAKHVEETTEPPYRINSFDLQTSQGDELSSVEETED